MLNRPCILIGHPFRSDGQVDPKMWCGVFGDINYGEGTGWNIGSPHYYQLMHYSPDINNNMATGGHWSYSQAYGLFHNNFWNQRNSGVGSIAQQIISFLRCR